MLKNSSFLRLFVSASLLTFGYANAGVSADTIVATSEGPKVIGVLKIGDKIICFNENLAPEDKTVEAVEEVEASSAIEITTEDDVVMHVSPDQRLFVPYKWVQADQLSLGDVLLKQDHTFIRIKGICHKQGPVTMRFIKVEKHQNFLASENGVLVHNGVWGASIGCFIGKSVVHIIGHGAILIASTASGPAAWLTGISLEACFFPKIELLSHAGAVVGGIIGGVLTGPV